MGDTNKMRVFLVEDDRVLADLLARQFVLRGAEIVIANTGKDAINILEKDATFNVIILDLSLPDIDGFEILSRIKDVPVISTIPVIVISNFAVEKDAEWARKLGVSQFLKKVSLMPGEIVDIAFQTNEGHRTFKKSDHKGEDFR